MNKIKGLLSELEDIISDYDDLLSMSAGHGIYSSSDYEKMDSMRNRAYEIIESVEIQIT